MMTHIAEVAVDAVGEVVGTVKDQSDNVVSGVVDLVFDTCNFGGNEMLEG